MTGEENYFSQFRNQYDSDVTVWSPQGRLHQVEYAMEAVKLGSATVGLKNKTHAVLIALKRASSELSAHQKKIIPIDKHMGITIAGLTADARMLRFVYSLFISYLLLAILKKKLLFASTENDGNFILKIIIFSCYLVLNEI